MPALPAASPAAKRASRFDRRGEAILGIEEEHRAQQAVRADLEEPDALELECVATGLAEPTDLIEHDAIAERPDERAIGAEPRLRGELHRRDPGLDVSAHERPLAAVFVNEVGAGERTNRVPVAGEEGVPMSIAHACRRGRRNRCASIRSPRPRAIGAQRLEARERPVEVVRIVEVAAQRLAAGIERGDQQERALEGAAVARSDPDGLGEHRAARHAQVIPAKADVGRECDQRAERLDECGAVQRSPAHEPVIVTDEPGCEARGERVPVAPRECRVEVPQERELARVLRAFAGAPTRIEFGVRGVEIFEVPAIVRRDRAALVRLDQHQRVDCARADRLVLHRHRGAHQREPLAARREEIERSASRSHREQRAGEVEEARAIEVELEEAPAIPIAERPRVERFEARDVARPPCVVHHAPRVRCGVLEAPERGLGGRRQLRKARERVVAVFDGVEIEASCACLARPLR